MDRITIGNRLLDFGFNPANLGFEYLIEAISIYKTGMPMGEVYGAVAKKFNTTPTRAERCMRHSREKTEAYKNMDNREMIARFKFNLEAKAAAVL